MSLTKAQGMLGAGFTVPGDKSKGRDKRTAGTITQQSWPALFMKLKERGQLKNWDKCKINLY